MESNSIETREKIQVIVRMPVALKEQLQTAAYIKGISLNAYILLIIENAQLNQ